MKKFLILPAALVMLASPALAQSNDSNLETNRGVLEGARQSQEPGMGTIQEGRSSTMGSSNSSNLETQDEVLQGAEDSATPGEPGSEPIGSIDGGANTNSGNLGQ